MGDTTNVAARLQSSARPGQVLASRTTCERIRGSVTVESVGPMSLRGKDNAVKVIELVGMPGGMK
jgi:adenylate cyclase